MKKNKYIVDYPLLIQKMIMKKKITMRMKKIKIMIKLLLKTLMIT